MNKYDKLEIADEMLDAAINEFLVQKRFFAALNLAAVAEELYGKHVRICHLQDALQENIEAAKAIAKSQVGPELDVKEWKKIANEFKNQIKHFDSEADRYVAIDAEDEARLMINDALTNHWKLERVDSEEVGKFVEWAKAYVFSARRLG